VNTTDHSLDTLVASFAADFLRLAEPGLADRLLADPLLVLGPQGTAPVPREAFLAAVGARASRVGEATDAETTLVGASGQALGERMVIATLRWEFRLGTTTAPLVSDVLLQREGTDGLRCVAYLPRTNVLDHLP